MFNYATCTTRFREMKVLGGIGRPDAESYRTLFCGPDPADPDRVLIRKIVKLRDHSYAYEETRVTRKPNTLPDVHTIMHKLGEFDLTEDVSNHELAMRYKFHGLPNMLGFSLYYRKTGSGINHLSIVENSLWKKSGQGWSEWWKDLNDRRDIACYLRKRWLYN